MTSNQEWLYQLLTLLGSGLVVVTSFGLKKLADYLAAQTKSQALKSFWQRTDDLAERVVKETYQAYVEPLKAAGTWTPAAAATAKAQAIAKLKSYVGLEGLRSLEYLFGGGDGKTLDAFLGTFVEAAVHDVAKSAVATAAPLVSSALGTAAGIAAAVQTETKTAIVAGEGAAVALGATTKTINQIGEMLPLADPAKP